MYVYVEYCAQLHLFCVFINTLCDFLLINCSQ